MRVTLAVAVIALCGPMLAGPPADAPFWSQPDEETRDAAAHVIGAIVKDRVHYTMRALANGKWITYRFEPHTDKVLFIDGGDVSLDVLYDGNDNQDGYRAHVDGLTLTARATRGGVVTTPGLLALVKNEDALGRHALTRTPAGAVELQFDTAGFVRQVSFGREHLDLGTPAAGKARQALYAGTRLVREVTVPAAATGPHRQPLFLDPLGLPPGGANGLRMDWDATRIVARVRDAAGATRLYLVAVGLDRVGFDVQGKPLFYDVALNAEDRVTPLPSGGDVAPSHLPETAGITPTRLLATADAVGVYIERAPAGAIEGVWVEGTGATRQLHYR